MRTDADQTSILFAHDAGEVVGHGRTLKGVSSLDIVGKVSGVGVRAREVLRNAKNGYRWRASVGCELDPEDTPEFIKPGETLRANGP